MGVVASIKPFLGMFLFYLVATKRWRPLGWFVMGGAAAAALGLAVFGLHTYREWLQVVAAVDWGFAPMNASIHGLLRRSLSENSIFQPVARAPSIVTPVATILGVAIGIVTIKTATRDQSPEAVDRAFAMLILAALLISPLGWMYYLCLAGGPIAALVKSLGTRHARARDVAIALALPGLLIPLFVTTLWAGAPWNSATLGSLYGWTALWMWTAVWLDGHASHRAAVIAR
jgi:hypothetical protein